jgi:UDP:flavonoid glycosyltransferase YjiC (YdhE family)
MKILLAPMAGAFGLGAITRCLAIGEHAALRGHQVAVCAPSEYQLLDLYFHGPRFPAPRPVPHPEAGAGDVRVFAEGFVLRGMDSPEYVACAVAAERQAIREFGADIVFTENQPSVAISTELEGIPFAATAATVDLDAENSMPSRANQTVPSAYRQVATELGATPHGTLEGILHRAAALNIAPTIDLLEPALSGLPNLHYVGPLLFGPIELGPTRTPEPGRDHVLAYLSRGLVTVEQALSLFPAAFPPANFDITLASTDTRAASRDMPFKHGNVYCEHLPPLTSALGDSVLLVTRGGQNTLMSALLAGCPVLGLPGEGREPEFNLQTLERHGAALTVSKMPTVEALKKASASLLTQNARDSARALGDDLRNHLGPLGAVQLMEAVVHQAAGRGPG